MDADAVASLCRVQNCLRLVDTLNLSPSVGFKVLIFLQICCSPSLHSLMVFRQSALAGYQLSTASTVHQLQKSLVLTLRDLKLCFSRLDALDSGSVEKSQFRE
jgi:hypothetical protein